ncbi:isopeptide-forming domain-containing fimbrial protein, partial [Acaricomes phytoseiuli]|uniref:isopeptide-forming domain-containing fimbrial protein n=2 Tax=Acaricomes phytoseiuli TaxID=291968 RepID=UPI0022219B80
PGYEHAKVSDPAPGTSVKGGQQIKYTVTGKNTGETRLDPVKITDDMSKVLDKAAYNNDVVARVFNADGSQVSGVPAASLDGSTLSWSGVLEPGQRVELVYSVTVNADVPAGVLVENRMTSTATPPTGEPIEPPEVVITHPIISVTPTDGDDPLAITGAGSWMIIALLVAGVSVLFGTVLLFSPRKQGRRFSD